MWVQTAEKDPRNAVVDLSAEQTPCPLPVVQGGRGATAPLGTKRACVTITTALHAYESCTRTSALNRQLTVDDAFRVTIEPP
jgi:hypothetical protein